MVTMWRGRGYKIAVYGAEHGVPHFHIEGPNFRCSVAIRNLDVIVGTAPRHVLVAALDWAALHRSELAAKWKEQNR